ncbi:rho GTPase-activating protein 23 isoform X3 [Nothobranchius furzeri]|uniref:rho GTPase-activating protein 23 isoform X3 n=1 Tax=Nothobranchius furzeri TaxID=105023 RepID=UPI00390489BA
MCRRWRSFKPSRSMDFPKTQEPQRDSQPPFLEVRRITRGPQPAAASVLADNSSKPPGPPAAANPQADRARNTAAWDPRPTNPTRDPTEPRIKSPPGSHQEQPDRSQKRRGQDTGAADMQADRGTAHCQKKGRGRDEENGNSSAKGCDQSRLEPMDTIFVKSVKENGPAQQAGLCTGDRLVKVNGESILGKTYSQVIALIQNSENTLELSIMPKDEDVLQLAYSQDAYLKGNKPYTGEADNLPEPPPLCYPHTKPSHNPLDNCPATASTAVSNSPRALEDSSSHFGPLRRHHGRSSSAFSALEFHFVNHNAAISSATLPLPQKSSLPASSRTQADILCHQALADWYYSQAEAAEHMSPRHHSISQDHLVELGLGLALSPRPKAAFTTSTEQHRGEALLHHHQAAAASHESYWLGGREGGSGPGIRSCSESLLAAYAQYEHNYGRSVETLAEASALVSQHYDQASQSPHKTKSSEQKGLGGHQHQATGTSLYTVPPSGRQPGQQVAEPQTRCMKGEEMAGFKSYSPSFSRKAGHLLQQAHSFREPSYTHAVLDWNPSKRGDCAGQAAPRPLSTPASCAAEEDVVLQGEDRKIISPISLNQEVVLRQKMPAGCWTPIQALQRSSYTTPADPPGWTPSSGTTGTGSSRRINGSLVQHAFDSLSSIPFIGSIKSRRSSYLLAITPERSKSCDEGLNTFRDEGRVFSKLPKRVKSFFTDGSLESLRVQEEARSKRHSTSELGTTTVSHVRKEGWLHYKQVLTEKGKKVGGSMRPWRRVFTVLRHHSLFLHKDKREALLHGTGAEPSQDEQPPISIRGCLIDIAYSETKRKHALRLTTEDFCEYLLQAEDRDDMLAWIRVIKDNSKTDNEEIGFSRQALINKKLNDYRKQSLTGNKSDPSPRTHRMVPPFLQAKTDDSKALWGISIMKKTKKTGSPKAFGVRLEDCQPAVNHKFVPLIVEMCCGVVEATGLEYTGIYRVPGNNALVSNLQEHLNKGLDLNTAEERWQDLNVISSLLKSFFRKLPEPLFTDDKYNDFIEANRVEDGEERLKTMKKLIHDLPNHYYHTLKFLVGHLKRVADHSEKNKMEPRNIALVFGPTLVRTSEDNMTDMVTHMPDRYKIVETLILHYHWFFSNGELRQEAAAPEDKWDMQPVPNIDHLLTNIGRPGMPREASESTTSGSVNSKNSSGSRKDHSARDFLSRTIISAMTRKRKKGVSTRADEDSDHEPVKATNYGGEDGVVEEHTCSRADEGPQKEKVADAEDGKEGRTETGARTESGKTTSAWWLRPNQSPAPNTTLHLKSRGRPSIPHWICPQLQQQPDQRQAASVHYRMTWVGRARSMNVELELDWNQDQVRDAKADGAEVIRVHEPGPGPTVGSGSETLLLPPASGSSVVPRKPVRNPQDKTGAGRRHTVVV